jgi:signal transduction histidine kinase
LKGVEDQVMLTIRDDGVGFDLASKFGGDGNGLRNMQERARKLGGELQVESQVSKGTSLRLSFPLQFK